MERARSALEVEKDELGPFEVPGPLRSKLRRMLSSLGIEFG